MQPLHKILSKCIEKAQTINQIDLFIHVNICIQMEIISVATNHIDIAEKLSCDKNLLSVINPNSMLFSIKLQENQQNKIPLTNENIFQYFRWQKCHNPSLNLLVLIIPQQIFVFWKYMNFGINCNQIEDYVQNFQIYELDFYNFFYCSTITILGNLAEHDIKLLYANEMEVQIDCVFESKWRVKNEVKIMIGKYDLLQDYDFLNSPVNKQKTNCTILLKISSCGKLIFPMDDDTSLVVALISKLASFFPKRYSVLENDSIFKWHLQISGLASDQIFLLIIDMGIIEDINIVCDSTLKLMQDYFYDCFKISFKNKRKKENTLDVQEYIPLFSKILCEFANLQENNKYFSDFVAEIQRYGNEEQQFSNIFNTLISEFYLN